MAVPLTIEQLLTLSLALVGALVWMVRLEGRVNKLEGLLSRNDDDHGELKKDIKYLIQRLDRILEKEE